MDIRGRMGTRYEDALHPVPVEAHAASGYFSKPATGLDPHLFVGKALRLNVRKSLLRLLYSAWRERFSEPELWSTVWLAGSGVSYQWDAARGGVGDLDTLIGVDFNRFRRFNPEFRGLPEIMVADLINKGLHDELWPQTSEYDFGGRKYEVTFYVNPRATDIRSISPYAAYNVTTDEWTVQPIELPEDWGPASLPKEWWTKFDVDTTTGQQLIERYNQQAEEVRAHPVWHPRWVNATAALKDTIEQANALFEEIHAGRKNSFSAGGAGYRGFENARWQVGKGTGVLDGLRQIRAVHSQAMHEANKALYGDATLGTEEAVVRSSLAGTKYQS